MRSGGVSEGPMRTSLLYDGLNAIEEISGGVPSATMLTGGLDEVFARNDQSGGWDVLPTLCATPIALADSMEASPLNTATNRSGAPLRGSPSGNTVEFAGRESDSPGLDYFRARYYSPTTGRFLPKIL